MVPAPKMTTFFFCFWHKWKNPYRDDNFQQIKAEKAICSDGVSDALQGVPWQG
jgi:hypothetical protein